MRSRQKEQIRIAAASCFAARRERGTCLHAIQCRINAEDWAKNFRVMPGRIDFIMRRVGGGVRIDFPRLYRYIVPPYYDSLIAKAMTVASTRIECHLSHAARADEYLHHWHQDDRPVDAAMTHGDSCDGNYDTGLDRRLIPAGQRISPGLRFA